MDFEIAQQRRTERAASPLHGARSDKEAGEVITTIDPVSKAG
jgi:hypothetical protein